MSLADVITSLCDVVNQYRVRRTGVGRWVKGRYSTEGTQPSILTITAGIVPVGDGRVLQDNPESQYGEEERRVYTATALATRSPAGEPDVLEIEGEDWVVEACARWQGLEETIYVAKITRYATP